MDEDQQLLGAISDAMECIEVPGAIRDWADQVQSAAAEGASMARDKMPGATREYMAQYAKRRALNEIEDELRRRGGQVNRAGKVIHDPARFVAIDDSDEPYDRHTATQGGAYEVVDPSPSPLATLIDAEDGGRAKRQAISLRLLVVGLPREQHAIVSRVYLHGSTLAQAASELGMTARHARTVMRDALASLRASMARDTHDTHTGTRSRVAGVPSRGQQGQAASHTKVLPESRNA